MRYPSVTRTAIAPKNSLSKALEKYYGDGNSGKPDFDGLRNEAAKGKATRADEGYARHTCNISIISNLVILF